MHSQRRLILTLIPLVMALPLAMDVYIPALPDMARYFAVNPAAMQLTLTLFMLAASAMQLFIGPLSDQTGRKFTLFLSIAAFGGGTLLCASAHSLASLVLYRMLQAAGCCGMMGLAFAVVRDRHTGTDSAAIYAYLSGIVAFSPMFAPFVGSFVDIYFGWRATFIVLMLVVLWSLISVWVFLPETLPPSRRQHFHWQIFKNYWQVLQHPRFYWYTLFSAMGMAYFYLFCAMSPYVIITLLHIPEAHYGYYFAFMGVSLFAGSVLAGKIVARLGIYKLCLAGFLLSFMGGLIMAGWYWATGLSIANFIWPMLLIGIGGAFQFGVGTAGSMEPFEENAGAAAGLGGAFRFAFLALTGSVVITKHIDSTLPLSLTAIVFSLISFFIAWRWRSELK